MADRAPIFAVIYLLSYSGATIPSLISAQLTNVFSLPQITLGYLGLAVAATAFIAVSFRNPRTSTINDIQQNDLATGGENPSR